MTLPSPTKLSKPGAEFIFTKFLIALSIFSLAFTHLAAAQNTSTWLQEKRDALSLEYVLVTQNPATFYLIVDLSARQAHLKADANLLRTCDILETFGPLPGKTQKSVYVMEIPPVTPLSGTFLENQPLPLDFVGRLGKGPKHRSRLYFEPAFMIQSIALPHSDSVFGLVLNYSDVKALGSALRPTNVAILMPNLPPSPGGAVR